MRLPNRSIRQIFFFVIAVGIALGLFSYGILYLLVQRFELNSPLVLFVAILIGIGLGLCLFLSSRLALRIALSMLRNRAIQQIGSPSDVFTLNPNDDELTALSTLFDQVHGYVPDHELHKSLAQDIATKPIETSTLFNTVISRLVQDIPIRSAMLYRYLPERQIFLPLSSWGTSFTVPELAASQKQLKRLVEDQIDLTLFGSEARKFLPILDSNENSLLCLPILLNQTLTGMVIFVSHEHELFWSPQQRAQAYNLANQLSIVLQLEQFQNQTCQNQKQRQIAIELVLQLLKQIPSEEFLASLLQACTGLSQSSHALIVLSPSKELTRRLAIVDGSFVPVPISHQLLQESLIGSTLRTRNPSLINDTQNDIRWLKLPSFEAVRSALVIPLFSVEELAGVVLVAHTKTYHYNDQVLSELTKLTQGLRLQLSRVISEETSSIPDKQHTSLQTLLPHLSPSLLQVVNQDGDTTRYTQPQQLQAVVLALGLQNIAEVSQQLDPERVFGEILQPFTRLVSEVADSFQAYIDHANQEGAVLVFGYPQTQQVTAPQALEAAYHLQLGLQKLHTTWRNQFHVRINFSIGLATGAIMVGQADTYPYLGRHLVLGQAVDQAQQLRQVGRPSEVICDQALQNAVEEFDLIHKGIALESLQPFLIGEQQVQAYRFTNAI